jgi:hypothetical protein
MHIFHFFVLNSYINVTSEIMPLVLTQLCSQSSISIYFQATRTQPEYQPVESDPENLPLRDMAQDVASLSPLRSGFAPESFRVEFVVGKVALGHNFLRVLCFPLSVSFHHGHTSSNITSEMNNRPVGGSSSETWCHPVDINSNKGQ